MSTRYVTSFFEVKEGDREECLQQVETLVPVTKGQRVYINPGDSERRRMFEVTETPTIGIYNHSQAAHDVDTVNISVKLRATFRA